METRFTRKLARLRRIRMTLIASLVFSLTCTANSQLGNSIAAENRAIAKPGGFQLLVYDAPPPGNIEAINLTVVSVDVVRQDGGVINISDRPTTFNLLNYREGNPLELANKVIPSGRYSEIRLKLNEDNSIVVSGQTKSLKTPSAQQSGVKLKGHFEIVEGLLYTMRLHFDPNKSVAYNPGPDRYILKPVIEIAGNSLVDGPFTVTGLIENETVVAELNPDGTLRMIGTFDPRLELRGRYYFNYETRVLSLDLGEVKCATCVGIDVIPGNIIHSLPDSRILVNNWQVDQILGTVGEGLGTRTVSFAKASSFALEFSQDNTVINVIVTYPPGSTGKIGILSLIPETVAGRSFTDFQKIINDSATFSLKIPYTELPGGLLSGRKQFRAYAKMAANLADIKINGAIPSAICGTVEIARTNYLFEVPVADKVLALTFLFDREGN